MAVIDHLQCGRVIIFNSILFKLRWAFCINYDFDEQIVYRGLFGLRAVDRKTFLGFARIVEIFDHMDRELGKEERTALRLAHKNGMRMSKTVQQYIDAIFKTAKIKLFISPEGWKHEDIHTR